MPIILLAIFVAIPIVEIAVFIQVGGWIGLWPTLGVVVLTAIVGTWLLRLQGLAVLRNIRAQLDRGQMPAAELFDGACLLVAGVLLLTPGFVTDACGLLLFVPGVRNLLRRILARYITVRHVGTGGRRPGSGPGTIDGEAVEVGDPSAAPVRDAIDEAPPRRQQR
jgi:UPF0716 protein FxsA